MRLVGKALTILSGAAALAAILSCGDGLAPLSRPAPPEELVAKAVGVSAVRLTWKPVTDPDLAGYVVERRVNHQGDYQPLPGTIPTAEEMVVFIDTDVQPETFYGYRVRAFTRFGDRSRPSVVTAARTPSPPGIVVATHTTAPVTDAMDPDGYRVILQGRDTVTAAIGLAANHLFTGLRAGQYSVILTGVIPRCSVASDSVRTVAVVDTGVNTITPVVFDIRCRDPKRGRIIAKVVATGDSLSTNGFHIAATGIASDETLPDSLRLYSQQNNVPSAGGSADFDNLRPGSYEIELQNLESHCSTTESLKRTVAVTESAVDTVQFRVLCQSNRPPDDGSRPLVLTNTWSAESAAPSQRVSLTVALDASARPAIKIASVQGELRYDPALLQFESMEAVPGGSLNAVTVNGQTPGVVTYLSSNSEGLGFAGLQPAARAEFTVIGAIGQKAATRSKALEIADDKAKLYTDSTRAVEDTLSIGAGGGAPKQPPTASHGGPYTGNVGTPVIFNGSGSLDPDGGAIASYRWDFGDGTPAATVTTPTTQHTFAAACTCTVSLTVTDDEAATATASTTASITNDVPVQGKPYVWRNTWSAPSASVGQTVTLRATLDLSASPQNVASVTGSLTYDPAALQFVKTDTIATNGFKILTGNGSVPGTVDLVATNDNGLVGVVGVAKIEFTVKNGAPSSTTTQMVFHHADDLSNKDLVSFTDSVRVVEGTLQIGSGGGGGNPQPPIASPNGPYSGTTGVAVAFSSAGSVDPDGGSLVSYLWNFGDSQTSTQQNPSHTYAAAGTYSVTLKVTDDENATHTATTSANIVAPGPSQPLVWSYGITTDSLVSLEVLYDLQADLPETPGAEKLATWKVDSLKWNPAVLQFKRVVFGTGFAGGSVQDDAAASGKLIMNGSLLPAMGSGFLQLAIVQFRILGASGASTTTQTFLGALKNAANFDYKPLTQIKEATVQIP
ncbi:MAG TPA: PKD domain-containing protein [Gemmatimonadaceae bacterium]|nr:PKD domain-containing protein [Gemmatimonadaceae bacterium]